MATALAELPVLSAALAEGRLCFEQVRALTPLATPETEAWLFEEAGGMTATGAEALVRRLREVPAGEARAANASRSLRLLWGSRDRMLRVSGTLPGVDGAVVASAIEGRAERSVVAAGDPEPGPREARCAYALVELCSVPGGGHAGCGSVRHPSAPRGLWATTKRCRLGPGMWRHRVSPVTKRPGRP